MANTITLNSAVQARESFQGAFGEMWKVKATISDQDALALNDTLDLDLTVTGVALGDMVVGVSLTVDADDGTDAAVVTAVVSAANTVTIRLQADLGELAADTLNNAVAKVLVGRPVW